MWRNRHAAHCSTLYAPVFLPLLFIHSSTSSYFLLGPLCDLLSCVGVLPMNLAEHPVVCFGNQILLGTFHNPLFWVLSYDELLSQLIFPSFSLKHLPSFFPCDNEGKQEVKGGGGGGTEGSRMSCITVHPEVWHWHNILFWRTPFRNMTALSLWSSHCWMKLEISSGVVFCFFLLPYFLSRGYKFRRIV